MSKRTKQTRASSRTAIQNQQTVIKPSSKPNLVRLPGETRLDFMDRIDREEGGTIAAPDDPIYSEGATVRFVSHRPTSSKPIFTANKKISMKLALIPAGKFTMGSPTTEKGRSKDEAQHEVTISKPFYMGVCAVTQAQYEAVMGSNPSRCQGPTNPVEQVPWHDAVEFCKRLSAKTGKKARLPTEAEWEYACRAGSKTRFSYGDDDEKLGDYTWYDKNSEGIPHPVGQKKANGLGLYDMHGNVWEWCADCYADAYASAKTKNPQGPDSGTHRVLRGGSHSVDSIRCRSARRSKFTPRSCAGHVGFRVAVDFTKNGKPQEQITLTTAH